MEGEEQSLAVARRELIRLIESDDCRITARAETQGKAILRREGMPTTERGLVAYVLRLLQADYPMHRIKRGQPEGSLTDGYVMNNADGQGLYRDRPALQEGWAVWVATQVLIPRRRAVLAGRLEGETFRGSRHKSLPANARKAGRSLHRAPPGE